MKVLKFLSLFMIVFMIIMMIGCSKHITGPEVEEPEEVQSLMAVYSVEADDTPLTGVSVYTLEGVPATLRPWPDADRNLTPVEFNEIEPGSYTLVGVKAGYDTSYTSVVITEGASETVYLVMHEREDPPLQEYAWLNLLISPENTTIYLDAELWGEGISTVDEGWHTVEVSKDGYESQSVDFKAILGDTVTVEVNLLVEEEPEVVSVSDSLIYIEGGDKASKGDTLIVQGTKIFEHYKVVVLNGSSGPIRHIDMCTGWDYKNNKQFTVIRDCCTDVVKIPLNQFAHMYDHVTLQVGTDPEETSDWSYYGRFDIYIGLRGIVEIPGQDQWWDMLRIL